MAAVRSCLIIILCGLFCLLSCSQSPRDAAALIVATNPSAPVNDSIARQFNPAEASHKAALLDTFFHNLQQKYGFNGTVLVAQYGHVIYKGAFGYRNLSQRDTLTTTTPFQLASVSKQFTAVSIMQLKEKGLLKYDDPVWKYIPDFPYDSSITLRMLLTHRSGLPSYQYGLERFYNKSQPLSNSEVVEKLCQYKPVAYGSPDQRFHYNNTNYVLLAYIVEKVSGKPFSQYAEEHLFRPLGMNNTFVYDGHNENKLTAAAMGYTGGRRSMAIDYLDSVTGDKSLYSTAEDLFKWDRGLYSEQLVSQKSLEEAFRPAHDDANLITKNYGFGWRLQKIPNEQWLTFHTGWWHGFKNYFMRNRADQSTIILLSNVANSYMSQVKMVQAILYPEKARFFLRGENIDPESGELPGESLQGGGAHLGTAELSLSDLYKMLPPAPIARKAVRHAKGKHAVVRKGHKKGSVNKAVVHKKAASKKKKRR
ncbi:MAG: serine hydrolase domain-containing protein [Siphonobacter sp.]